MNTTLTQEEKIERLRTCRNTFTIRYAVLKFSQEDVESGLIYHRYITKAEVKSLRWKTSEFSLNTYSEDFPELKEEGDSTFWAEAVKIVNKLTRTDLPFCTQCREAFYRRECSPFHVGTDAFAAITSKGIVFFESWIKEN